MFVGHEGRAEYRRALPVLRQIQSLGVVVNLPQELRPVLLLENIDAGLDVFEPCHLVLDDVTLHEQRALVGDELVDDHGEMRVGLVGHVGANDVTKVLCQTDIILLFCGSREWIREYCNAIMLIHVS